MAMNPQQLARMGILLNQAATDLRRVVRTSGGFQVSGERLTEYARQIRQFARRLKQTQRAIDGMRSARSHVHTKHRLMSHQGSLDAVEAKAMTVALLLEQILFSPAQVDFGRAGRGGQSVAGGGPSKLNKRSLTDIALKLQKLLSQSQAQLSASALSDLNAAHAQITATAMPGAVGDPFTAFLMTLSITLESLRMWGMATGRITHYHE